MANPTKSQLISDLQYEFDSVTASVINLTDTELIACFNKMLDVAKTVDPVKGTPTVKF